MFNHVIINAGKLKFQKQTIAPEKAFEQDTCHNY